MKQCGLGVTKLHIFCAYICHAHKKTDVEVGFLITVNNLILVQVIVGAIDLQIQHQSLALAARNTNHH